MSTGPPMQPQQSAKGARNSAQIKEFIAIRRLGPPSDDPSGCLLNEAVAVHLDHVDHTDTAADAYRDEEDASAILRRKLEDLEKSRQKFMKHLSEEQKFNLAKSSNTTEAILATIASANFEWCKRRECSTGAASAFRRNFHRACQNLDQNASLFTMLPKGNEYIAPFYGAFNTIVSASVMSQAMATGLPRIVDELNSIVRDVANKVALYPRVELRTVLINLYIRIFDLLAKLMEWYSKNKHFLRIIRKDCYNDFESDLKDIRTWASMVRSNVQTNMVLENRQAQEETRAYQQRSMKELQKTAEVAEKYFGANANDTMMQIVAREQQHLLTTLEARQEDFQNRLMSRFDQYFKTIGAAQTGTLTSMAETMMPNFMLNVLPSDDARYPPTDQNQDRAAATVKPARKATYARELCVTGEPSPSASQSPQTREDIERYSRILDDWYPEGHMHPISFSQGPGHLARPAMYEAIAARISNWTEARESQVLCIQLHYNNTAGTTLGSKIASYVVSSAWEVQYPILSYFCTLPRTAVAQRIVQTMALCEMMASLIRQCVSMLPDTLPETAASLDEARFACLDGTLRTWRNMLGIFAQLLSLVPRSLLIVIHGLQCLNSNSTTDRIVEFLDVIRERIGGQETETVEATKILLLNEGQSRAVVPWLKRGELSMHEGV